MRILITGKNSYIGIHINEWIKNKHHDWNVQQVSVRDDNWKKLNFEGIDTIIHLAAIVHTPNLSDQSKYEYVNTILPINIATLARKKGVKQFIFFSTMAVYGEKKQLTQNIIENDTPLFPVGLYGKSKLAAELELLKLKNKDFKVTIIRPPNVYGKGCKGGYISGFTSIVKILPIIPRAYENSKQSLIYIDNLSECTLQLIEKNKDGIFMPSDEKPVSAIELMSAIANCLNKQIYFSKILGLGIKLFSFLNIIKKVYGGIEYSRTITTIKGIDYIVVPFAEAIKRTIVDIDKT